LTVVWNWQSQISTFYLSDYSRGNNGFPISRIEQAIVNELDVTYLPKGYAISFVDSNRVWLTDHELNVVRVLGQISGSDFDQFREPNQISSSVKGEFYVADSGNNRIKYYDEQGKLRKIWGTYGEGPGQFDFPQGICVGPDGLVYVADTYNHRIQVFTKDGNYVAQFGSFGSTSGKLNTISLTV
jgi:DNA-binding beta-propeller fold protein YncE